MTLTPNRDAIRAAAAERRRIHADELACDDAAGIARRMAIDTNEALILGVADMCDRAIVPGLVWPAVGNAVAGALVSFLMTAADGDAERARILVRAALHSIEELAHEQLRREPDDWVVGQAEASPVEGSA